MNNWFRTTNRSFWPSTRPARWLAGRSAALGLAVALLAACSSSSSHTATQAGSQASGAVAHAQQVSQGALAPLSAVQLKAAPVPGVPALRGKTVLVVPVVGAAFATTLAALQQALSVAGLTMHTCDGQDVPGTMASCMEQATSLHAAAVMTLAVPYQLVPNAYNDLAAHHVPVLAAFQAPSGQPSSKQLAFVDNDPALLVALQYAENYITWKSNGAAKVLYLGILDNAAILRVSEEARTDFTHLCPGCSVDEINYSTAQADQIPQLVSAYLVRHPDTTYILGANLDVEGPGIVSALQSSGKPGIGISGTSIGLEGPQLIAGGSNRSGYLLSENYLAWQWTDALLRLMTGQPQVTYPAVGRLFDSTNVGSVKFTPATATTFTWFGQPTYQQTLRQAWGV